MQLGIQSADTQAHSCFTNLHMPLLAHGVDNTPLDRSPAGTTDGYAHLVVAGQTVELSFQLPGICCQLPPEERGTVKCTMSAQRADEP